MNQGLQYYSLASDILCVTYFLTSITMPHTQTNDMHQIRYKCCQRFLWHQLALTSCEFYV